MKTTTSPTTPKNFQQILNTSSISPYLVNLVREDERVRRLQMEALGRVNYFQQYIAEKKSQAIYQPALVASENVSSFIDESVDIPEKNAELHILSTDFSAIYYYYEHETSSWMFLERDRFSGGSTLYSVKRRGPNVPPMIQTTVN